MSSLTTDLRGKFGVISGDFAEEYNEKFKDFTDKKLPKDELYYSIKD